MEPYLDRSMEAGTRVADEWLKFWNDVVRNVYETNLATARRLGLASGEPEFTEALVPSTDGLRSDWSFERTVDSMEDVAVGDVVTFSKRLTRSDVRAFARASGDTNRLHLDASFAERSRFGEPIVHGGLVTGVISAALARLPGLTIYLSQNVEFLGPVPVGERVTARCEVVEDVGGGRYRVTTVVTDEDDETVIDGEAVVLIDPLPEGTDAL